MSSLHPFTFSASTFRTVRATVRHADPEYDCDVKGCCPICPLTQKKERCIFLVTYDRSELRLI